VSEGGGQVKRRFPLRISKIANDGICLGLLGRRQKSYAGVIFACIDCRMERCLAEIRMWVVLSAIQQA
jgi:hypothetical protein